MYSIGYRPRPRRRVHPLDRAFFHQQASLAHEMDSLLGAFLSDAIRQRAPAPEPPRVRARQDSDALHLSMTLSGFEPQHLDVAVLGDVLTLSADSRRGATEAEKPPSATQPADAAPRHPARTFERSWRIPADRFQLDKVQATLDDSGLVVKVPVVPGPQRRQVTIQRAQPNEA